MGVITYPCWDISQTMLVKGGPGRQHRTLRTMQDIPCYTLHQNFKSWESAIPSEFFFRVSLPILRNHKAQPFSYSFVNDKNHQSFVRPLKGCTRCFLRLRWWYWSLRSRGSEAPGCPIVVVGTSDDDFDVGLADGLRWRHLWRGIRRRWCHTYVAAPGSATRWQVWFVFLLYLWRILTCSISRKICNVINEMKWCHFDELFVIGCTESCHFDNFRFSQWRKFCQNDVSISAYVLLVFDIRSYWIQMIHSHSPIFLRDV